MVTKTHALLTGITPYSDDVYRLDFAVDKRATRFKPGQFLHLTLDPFDPTEAYWPESRVFSICSVPKSETLSIIYSVKGTYTSRMKNELSVGTSYWIKLPYGDFIIDRVVPPEATVVLIAGGTGISPYIPYIEESLNNGDGRSIYLAYAVRSDDRIAFSDTLKRARDSDAVRLRVWSEAAASQHELITDHGVLDVDAVISDVTAFQEAHFLISGPPGMIAFVSETLQNRHGIDQRHIHIDEWE